MTYSANAAGLENWAGFPRIVTSESMDRSRDTNPAGSLPGAHARAR
ncbi:MAG: hypothetical protein U0790_27075 [Isosphaeraceae bacterium]